ncbi:NADH:ubiquinone reductase (Na(+)-transporting) subunit B [Tenacibaculum finnmarkense genomovar ulcerans]|uniref:NADH:ubiquinone reductase (Na(+)-transporting) subunit B n=1 Tax=Tenacibaculum finnmarkense TaxID=2781243 RepID=UPI001E51F859|nr:NADH:ubiquinone reductase (Na(+)-transporting) subunit B [Tenacibaculum finnmarkense]MCD8431726.1 NADH:ubiquinone reductase (Na(+)-transporting) subunit B [Tenacibaculum finnmarkense genomovar ulcerans]MCG8234996.1 NADH:ubiquinone reductase (Na(+)-transporting) subunit B [Tenacibaculum finnmarkense genomovar ulcerans]MCG8802398.1 NADH:ubiquinone reductase (Na(+)-transporting) subunit B [Tenacibaculum finnmarkense]MCG8807200.1 NADH:ubiquinone reductase (Na(+)-transporting) subunit B [Tenaciba
MGLKQNLHKLKEKYKGTKMAPAFNAIHTFLYLPNETTHGGTHIKAADDLKRTMNIVIMSLVPCLIFGMFNAGYQHNAAINGFTEGMSFFSGDFWNMANFLIGLVKILPLVIVSYVVGLVVEFIFAVIKGHEVEEGYLVTGMLVPLIVPIDLPLWMLSVAVVFGVVIGKEVFGGTGMNILNPALTIRAFLFFAYPTWMSGDKVWVQGARELTGTADAISGETILGTLAQSQPVTHSVSDMFFGFIPGSVGETSTFLILLGALFLIFTKIGSWRIMLSAVIGALVMGFIFNQVVGLGWIGETSKFYGLMSLDFWKHLLIGGFAFGAIYMATDPVSASQTNKGKWIYGFFIGFISIMIRVFNPAYPEGVMLAILLMNVFAPTIDHYVVQGNIKRRLKRTKVKTA